MESFVSVGAFLAIFGTCRYFEINSGLFPMKVE